MTHMKAAATSLLVLVATLSLFAYQQGIIHKPSSPSVVTEPTETPLKPTSGTLKLGVTTDPLARNWWEPWRLVRPEHG